MACSLNYEHLFRFSQNLTTVQDVRKLGFKILPEDTHFVDKELNAASTDISNATYNILHEWFKRQQNPKKAYRDLLNSLGEINLNQLGEALKFIVEGERTTSNSETAGQKTEEYVSHSEVSENIEDVSIDGQRNQQSTDVEPEGNNQFNVKLLLMLVVLIGTLGFFNMHVLVSFPWRRHLECDDLERLRQMNIPLIKQLKYIDISVIRKLDENDIYILKQLQEDDISNINQLNIDSIPVIQELRGLDLSTIRQLDEECISVIQLLNDEDVKIIKKMDIDLIKMLNKNDIALVKELQDIDMSVVKQLQAYVIEIIWSAIVTLSWFALSFYLVCVIPKHRYMR